MLDEEGQLIRGTLAGRTVFQRCRVHNIVGDGRLGCGIDLQAMCNAAPACCKWRPKLFAGLKCRIWLTPEHRCVCRERVKAEAEEEAVIEDDTVARIIGRPAKCVCAVKVLIFKSGAIVITGARRVSDVNAVFFRIKELAPQFDSARAAVASIPRQDAFYTRLGALMVPRDFHKPAPAKRREATLKPMDAFAAALAGVDAAAPTAAPAATAASVSQMPRSSASAAIASTPFMRLVMDGRYDVVRDTLLMDPSLATEPDEQDRTPLERLNAIPIQERNEGHTKLIELLAQKRRRTE
jgi:hypothetical protein